MLSTEMSVILPEGFGPPEILQMGKRPIPKVADGEVLIKVKSAGLNRADLLQRQGKYPPPHGASDILGMEVSGIVAALGKDVKKWKIGDKVCALLSGGGYAAYVVAPEHHCLLIPSNLSFAEAAALPEALVTVYANLFKAACVKSFETALIHGGASGIGTTAIQMLKAYGARVFVTVGTKEKKDACLKLGADLVINYKEEDFVTAINVATKGSGVNVILDMVGGSYINRNLEILSPFGRHVSIATQSGKMAEVDIRQIMSKQLILTGSTLRGRSLAEKSQLIAEIEKEIWPLVRSEKIKPLIYQSFPLEMAADAHKVMETGAHIGKIVLEVS
jgi:NADPH:quinone reductase